MVGDGGRTFLHLCSDGVGTAIHAVGACECDVRWSATARPHVIDEQLLELVAAVEDSPRLLSWDCRLLVALLQRPDVAAASGPLRTRLRDVMAGALLALPDSKDWTLGAIATRLGLGDDLSKVPDDPREGALLCREIAEALGDRLGRMPAPALALVRDLIGADGDFDWLPWDDLQPPPYEESALDMLLAGRPTVPHQRQRERSVLQRPIAETASMILSPGGPVAQAFDRYEHRPGQVAMAEAVAEALEDGGVLMVEAGTGVGKSLAYLVPSILWSRANASPVVVSTNTKNLQEQLINKDLPLLREALGTDFLSALLKGRSNYVCARRFQHSVREAQGSMLPEDRKAAAYLVSWLAASETCDLDLIPSEAMRVFGGLKRLIDRIRSERALCLGPGCPHARQCAVRVARAVARNADIVISNHALTLADTQADVLPAHSRIIFDEAHNLESVATDQLGEEISNFSFSDLRRTFGGDGRRRGFIDSLAEFMAEAHPAVADALSDPRSRLLAAMEALDACAEEIGAAVTELCLTLDPEAEAGRARIRLGPNVYAAPEWQTVAGAVAGLRDVITTAEDALGEMAETLAEGAERGTPRSDLSLEAIGARVAVGELGSAVGSIMHDDPGAGHVLWAETARRRWGEFWRLCAAPIDVGPALSRAVYGRRESVIMTSATLTVDGGFGYVRQRLGLNSSKLRVREEQVPSPFRYREQLLMCVPTDIPTRGEDGRDEALNRTLIDIAEVAGGGVLLLFTSRRQMDRVYEQIRDRLADAGLSPICQYRSGPRSWLLQQLRERDNTVLFGLKSFWEGVDVPGHALRCVVITKLPFAVPTDPIVQARCERAASLGLNGYDYYIPEAILAFKQGIGRLVRSTSDQGVVFVLDNRLITRGYGQRFFNSIPECRTQVGEFLDCLREAERWLKFA